MDSYAWELRAQIRSGEKSPTEAAEACLSRIDERDSSLRAFLHVDQDGLLSEAARQTAALARLLRNRPLPLTDADLWSVGLGPLAGIPLAVKDLEDVGSRFALLPSRSSLYPQF